MNFNLTIGDRLIRTKGGITSRHHALYAGMHNGVQLVAENQRGFGVRYITLNQFLSEGKLLAVTPFKGNNNQRQHVITRINALRGKVYDVVKYNCEHFVNEVLNGKPTSKQIENAGIVGLGLAFIGLLVAASR
jgi:hypothetical protein